MLGEAIRRIKKELWLTFKVSPQEKRHALVGPARIWKMERDFQIRFLKAFGLLPEHYFLDLGCGTLRGGIPVIAHLQAEHYYGVDVRKNVLSEAAKELAEAQLIEKQPILLLTEDISSLKIGVKFDIIWAFDVLYILSDDKLGDCLSFTRHHLKETGCLYGNVMIGERKDDQWSYGFPLIQREINTYSSAAQLSGLAAEDMGTIEALGLGTGQKKHDEKHMLRFVPRDYQKHSTRVIRDA